MRTGQQSEQRTNPVASVDALLTDGFMTVPEAAKFLGLGKSTVYELCHAGQLPYADMTERSMRIPREAVRQYAKDRLVLGNAVRN